MRAPPGPRDLLLLLLALAAIALAQHRLAAETAGVTAEPVTIDRTPAVLHRLEGTPPGPVVVIAHGFSGSTTLMRSLALTLARQGLAALSFDFLGHGRHPDPLGGDLRAVEGATAALVAQTRTVLAHARALGDGRVALLGHSMAGDVLVRVAALEPDVAAVVAISMLSPAATATTPRNLLAIAGEWEGRLADEALRLAGLASAPEPPAAGVTYGRVEDGTARRAVIAPGVEHVGVLFARTTQLEAAAWLAAAFGRRPVEPARPALRGPWIALLIGACLLAARPLLRLVPALPEPAPQEPASPAPPAGPWRRLLPRLALATLATPLVLRLVHPDLLPVQLADDLAAQLGLFGLLLLAGRGRAAAGPGRWVPPGRLLGACLGCTIALALPVVLAVHTELTLLPPSPARLGVMAALLSGGLAFFLGLEVAGRGPLAARGAPPAILLAFLLSLALAIALDPDRLLFLGALAILLLPVFLTTLLLGRWARRATGHPLPPALACAVLAAVLLGGTMPLLADP
jgi:hypothetical protein